MGRRIENSKNVAGSECETTLGDVGHLTLDPADTESRVNAFLEQLAFGVVIVDGHHYILRQNRAACEITQKADVLTNIDNRLYVRHHAGRLRTFIDSVLAKTEEGWLEDVLLLERPSTGEYCQIWGAPLLGPDGRTASRKGQAAAILVIIDPQRTMLIPLTILKSMFGLTATEISLAEAVLNGSSLEQFAECREISLNTARTHLKAIFSKTGTHGQVDLVRFLSQFSLPSTFILR